MSENDFVATKRVFSVHFEDLLVEIRLGSFCIVRSFPSLPG